MKPALWILCAASLVANSSCSGTHESPPSSASEDGECSAASRAQLDIANAVLVELEDLTAELHSRLVAACDAIVMAAGGPSPVVPSTDRTEVVVAFCSEARRAISAEMGTGVGVSAQPPECMIPFVDEACLSSCSAGIIGTDAETVCNALCDARAMFRVTCTAADLVVSNAAPALQASLEAELVPIFDAAARSELAVVGASEFWDAISVVRASDDLCAADYPELEDFARAAVVIQAAFVASTQITSLLR